MDKQEPSMSNCTRLLKTLTDKRLLPRTQYEVSCHMVDLMDSGMERQAAAKACIDMIKDCTTDEEVLKTVEINSLRKDHVQDSKR